MGICRIDGKIKEAVEELESCIKKYGEVPTLKTLKPLLTLAEEYLKVEGWPEEKIITFKSEESWKAGFNDALHLCKLAAMKEKSKVSREQIEGCLNSVFSEYALNGQGNRSLIKSLTEELLELINGKEKR